MKLKYIPWHPIIFSVYSVLFLYRNNLSEIKPEDLFFPLGLSFAIPLLLLLLSLLLFKNKQKPGLVLLLLSIIFFTYGNFVIAIDPIVYFANVSYAMSLLIVCYFAFFILLIVFVLRLKDSRQLTFSLNIIFSGLLLFTIIQIMISGTGHVSYYEKISAEKNTVKNEKLPDIYYFIFDSYSGFETLENLYKVDTSNFKKTLDDLGFYTPKYSKCNYIQTNLSLTSSLNMTYLSFFVDKYGENSISNANIETFMHNSAVSQFLKSKGYTIVHYSSGHGATNHNEMADVNIHFRRLANPLSRHLQATTALRLIVNRFPHFKRYIIPQTFENLKNRIGENSPKFVFIHFFAPHPPYMFKRDGSVVDNVKHSLLNWDTLDKFLEEIEYLNKEIIDISNALITESKIKPVILIQGDHGSRFNKNRTYTTSERAYILNSYFVPDRCKRLLYDSISPVNSFRVIFNCLFNTEYKLLEDDIYWSDSKPPFGFRKVTGEVVDYSKHDQ